jgi:succinoglycan biosynthesis transport protein ExoP
MDLPERVQWQARRLVRERPVYVPPATPDATPPDLLATMRKLLRQRYVILLCTGATALLTIAIVTQLPTRYVAEARILIGVPAPRALDITSIIRDESPDAERVQSEIFAIQSRDLAKAVIDQLQLMDNPEFNPTLPQQTTWMHRLTQSLAPSRLFAVFRGDGGKEATAVPAAQIAATTTDVLLAKLNVSALGRSNVISVQAEAATPDEAAAIANAFADRYLAQQRSDKIATTQRVETFLADRIAELRQQVEKAEQTAEDYRRENGLYRGASAGITSQQMTELNTQLVLAQTAKAEADARLKEAEGQRSTGAGAGAGDSVPDVLRSPLIQALKEQQAQVERRLAELSSSYGAQHPKILSAHAELADINRKLATEIGHTMEGLRHEAATATARYEALRQNFEQLQAQMGNVNDKSIRLEALERDATVYRNLLESMMGRAKETMGQQELQQANAKLLSPAAPPWAPAFPPKTLLVFLGTLGGLLIGTVLAMLREGSDRTFRLSEQIESATGLPVLAMVPNLRRSAAPALDVLERPISPFSEALRRLYIGLQISEDIRSPKTVLFCSATPGEGKSTIAASLARMLASNGRRVLLIDCDWRSPSLHRLFRCHNRGGLVALLEHDTVAHEDVIHSDAQSGVDIITAGNFTPSSMHRLMSPRLQLVIEAFAKSYDLVILDSPPVLVGAEVLSLCRLVDKVVYAIRWGSTRREIALDGLKQIVEAHGDVAGVVLSRVDARRYRQYAYGRLDYEYARASLPQLS